jgi:hypothetical protein
MFQAKKILRKKGGVAPAAGGCWWQCQEYPIDRESLLKRDKVTIAVQTKWPMNTSMFKKSFEKQARLYLGPMHKRSL